MKIVLSDFNYKGRHFDHYECEWPNVKNLDEVPEEKAIEYITESLNEFLKGENGNG